MRHPHFIPAPDLDPDDRPVPQLDHDPVTGLRWSEPTVPEPAFIMLASFIFDACAQATDSCRVEPDGICEHGHPSWLRRLGVI
ncbi:hypothetical protein MKK75_29905 [Methylobacterium sp. J-030]|uniref:hypothetical protein n=1 Tax=Methylobacterium sp. J-030 TaxID=2836627 RepID=UPI001FB8F239|nr:hypothetical protein [Methylobacterium sp. J-030]MCJ2072960.1 hypothetical protein [Methylobacterium sp. J-030]